MIPHPSILRTPQPFVRVLLYLCFGTSLFSYISFSFYPWVCTIRAFNVPPWLTVSACHQVLRYSRIAWHSKDSVEECSRSSQVSKKATEKCVKWDQYLRKETWKRDPHTRDSQRRRSRPGHVRVPMYMPAYGVATNSGLHKFSGFFCKKALFLWSLFFQIDLTI